MSGADSSSSSCSSRVYTCAECTLYHTEIRRLTRIIRHALNRNDAYTIDYTAKELYRYASMYLVHQNDEEEAFYGYVGDSTEGHEVSHVHGPPS